MSRARWGRRSQAERGLVRWGGGEERRREHSRKSYYILKGMEAWRVQEQMLVRDGHRGCKTLWCFKLLRCRV